jgi:hypothetical protein
MSNLSVRAKAALLAFSIAASTSNVVCSETSFLTCIKTSVLNNKTSIAAMGIAGILIALKIRLDTRPRGHYDYKDISGDIKELLASYNIFDAQSRANIMHFVDKYLVGMKLKLDDMTIRTKEDDGSVITLKRKKLTQRPSGFMGLFDSYVLQQMETNNKLLPAAAAFYVMLTNPQFAWAKAYTEATTIKK